MHITFSEADEIIIPVDSIVSLSDLCIFITITARSTLVADNKLPNYGQKQSHHRRFSEDRSVVYLFTTKVLGSSTDQERITGPSIDNTRTLTCREVLLVRILHIVKQLGNIYSEVI